MIILSDVLCTHSIISMVTTLKIFIPAPSIGCRVRGYLADKPAGLLPVAAMAPQRVETAREAILNSYGANFTWLRYNDAKLISR